MGGEARVDGITVYTSAMPVAAKSSEEEMVREALKAIAAPEGVALKQVYSDEDHSGSPALRVYFSVAVPPKLTAQRVKLLRRFGDAARDHLLTLELGRWPYVSFVEKKKRNVAR